MASALFAYVGPATNGTPQESAARSNTQKLSPAGGSPRHVEVEGEEDVAVVVVPPLQQAGAAHHPMNFLVAEWRGMGIRLRRLLLDAELAHLPQLLVHVDAAEPVDIEDVEVKVAEACAEKTLGLCCLVVLRGRRLPNPTCSLTARFSIQRV